MSVVALRNVKFHSSLKDVAKQIAFAMRCKYTVLDFGTDHTCKKKRTKLVYVRVEDPAISPEEAVQRLTVLTGKTGLVPFVPKNVPPNILQSKGRRLPEKIARKMNIPLEERMHVIFVQTLDELLRELQTKYMALFHLSAQHDHEPLRAITNVISDRLEAILPNIVIQLSPFTLSKEYRKQHPHSNDYHMIMFNLNAVEEARDLPRTHITMQELKDVRLVRQVERGGENIPRPQLEAVISTYSKSISNRIQQHLDNLDTTAPDDSEERAARNRVRKELKNLSFYIPEIISEVMQREILKDDKRSEVHMRIYGEPFIPPKDVIDPFVAKFKTRKVSRYARIYNCLWVTIPKEQYAHFMDADGTRLGGAVLVCRPSDIGPVYEVPRNLKNRIQIKNEGRPETGVTDEDINMDVEQLVDW